MARKTPLESAVEDAIEIALYLSVALLAALAVAALAVVDIGAMGLARAQGKPVRPFKLARGMWFRLRHQRAPIKIRTPNELLALDPTGFEHAIGQILREYGYRDVHHNGGRSDLGVDLTATDRHGDSLAIQCKRYVPGRLVNARDMQLFIGMITTHHKADRGTYVTTSDYTRDALRLGEQHAINMINGDKLTEIYEKLKQRSGNDLAI